MTVNRVEITPAAVKILDKIKGENPNLIFHLSGGCCDGSSPMLLNKDDFYINEMDVLLGKVEGVSFYMSKDQFEYSKHTHLTVDVVEGRGSSFSLEIPLGFRFIVRSRLFTEEENKLLLSSDY